MSDEPRVSSIQPFHRRLAAPIRQILAAFCLAALSVAGASAQGSEGAPPDVAAAPSDAQRTASGLASKVLASGTGEAHPDPNDRVRLHYTGWTPQGVEITSSANQEAPIFHLQEVFAGWREAVQLMVVGEERRFWIPEELGSKGSEGDPQGDAVFDIELVAIQPIPNLSPALREPPASAERTPSGAFTSLLEAGSGGERPQLEGIVLLNYTGWTTDGRTFDSTVIRGRPTAFPLSGVLAPFAEAVRMMVVGEKRQVWIPEELAAGNWVGSPEGPLVFEIELLRILPNDVLDRPIRQSGSG